MQDNLADNLASSRSRPSFWYDTNGQSVQCQGEGGHARSWGLCRVPSCATSIVTNRRCMEMFCDHATLPLVSLCNMVTCAHCATPQNKRRSFVAPGLPDTCQDLCSVISTKPTNFKKLTNTGTVCLAPYLSTMKIVPAVRRESPRNPKPQNPKTPKPRNCSLNCFGSEIEISSMVCRYQSSMTSRRCHPTRSQS